MVLAIAERLGKVNTTHSKLVHITYQQPRPNLCVLTPILIFRRPMGESRIDRALARINAAVSRIDTAREAAPSAASPDITQSARVMELVNAHEKLREEVSDTLRELDAVIEDLES